MKDIHAEEVLFFSRHMEQFHRFAQALSRVGQPSFVRMEDGDRGPADNEVVQGAEEIDERPRAEMPTDEEINHMALLAEEEAGQSPREAWRNAH